MISNTAGIASSTDDPNLENNSSSVEVEVTNAPCQLTTPENITVSADAGQAGAVVTYTNPTGTGLLRLAHYRRKRETIPAISCNPASGSFFPVGINSRPLLCADGCCRELSGHSGQPRRAFNLTKWRQFPDY